MTDALYATIVTRGKNIVVRLFEDEAPLTVKNFVGLATGSTPWRHPKTGLMRSTPLYDGTAFHRVMENFMIQAGDPLSNPIDGEPESVGTGGPGFVFEDEFTNRLEFDHPGILAMANSGEPNTNGSQWFITEVATPHLNKKHTIFGEVVQGFEIVPKIARVPTGPRARPLQPVIIERVTITRGR